MKYKLMQIGSFLAFMASLTLIGYETNYRVGCLLFAAFYLFNLGRCLTGVIQSEK